MSTCYSLEVFLNCFMAFFYKMFSNLLRLLMVGADCTAAGNELCLM